MQEPLACSRPEAVVSTLGFGSQVFSDPLPPDPARFESDILAIDRRALALRAARERVILPLARAAAAFVGRRAWRPLGFARLEDFGRERFRRSGRWLSDLAALGRELPRLRGLRAALTGDDGGRPIGQTAAVLVARAASPASTRAWIAAARGMSLRALREAAAAAREAGSEWPAADLSSPSVADASAADPREEPAELTAPEPEPDDRDRASLRLPLPRSVRAAFDEALDLHRAVEGREASVASFVEHCARKRPPAARSRTMRSTRSCAGRLAPSGSGRSPPLDAGAPSSPRSSGRSSPAATRTSRSWRRTPSASAAPNGARPRPIRTPPTRSCAGSRRWKPPRVRVGPRSSRSRSSTSSISRRRSTSAWASCCSISRSGAPGRASASSTRAITRKNGSASRAPWPRPASGWRARHGAMDT